MFTYARSASDRLRDFFAFAQCAPGEGWATTKEHQKLLPISFSMGREERGTGQSDSSCSHAGQDHHEPSLRDWFPIQSSEFPSKGGCKVNKNAR